MTEPTEPLTADELAVVMEMSDEMAHSASNISADLDWNNPGTGWTPKKVNLIHRSLRAKGYADFGHLVGEDDTLLRGRGYWLTKAAHPLRYPGRGA